MNNNLVFLSGQFLRDVRLGVDSDLSNKIRYVNLDELSSDQAKKAFWLNVYNAFVLKVMRAHPDLLTQHRRAFFTQLRIAVGGHGLSFDEVEHGILRKGTWKYSLGYVRNPWVEPTIKRLMLDQMDYRIHFALNCGQTSCPPITVYSEANLDQELENAMLSYLESEVSQKGNTVYVPRLLWPYLGDFGGVNGLKRLLMAQGIIANTKKKLRWR